ncbi:MAG: molybdopterin biosynthesis protein, partial [Chloroflexi bacterium]|nr:molybdopterin biosynthesis protein [Chloroflexota bacterium]
SPMGDDEFVRVKIGRVGERTIAAPLARGAGMITSMVRADGIVRIPRMSEGLAAGSSVDVDLLTDSDAVDHTAVLIGSHDPALDLLANEVHRRFAPAAVASTNVGSQGGLVALRRKNAHAAGCHLIDPATGAYNVADVRRILPGRDVVLVTFAHRQQGLMVAPGNPLDIEAIDDLVRDDVVFVNRQRGSGTRMLLDYELQRRGLAVADIAGYERELYTHVALAADVAAGGANAGLGVLAAARALRLDFIPLLEERYDLVIPREHYESPVLRPVLHVLRDPAFARQVEAMGGYDTSRMGRVAAEIPGSPPGETLT